MVCRPRLPRGSGSPRAGGYRRATRQTGPAARAAERERGQDPAFPADQPVRAGDRRPAVPVGEHGPDAHASLVREARRAQPDRGRRSGPHPRPARAVVEQAVTAASKPLDLTSPLSGDVSRSGATVADALLDPVAEGFVDVAQVAE